MLNWCYLKLGKEETLCPVDLVEDLADAEAALEAPEEVLEAREDTASTDPHRPRTDHSDVLAVCPAVWSMCSARWEC